MIFSPVFSLKYTELGCASNIAFYKIYEKHVWRATQIPTEFSHRLFSKQATNLFMDSVYRAE